MSRVKSIPSLFLAGVLLLGGCGGQQRSDVEVRPVCFADADKAAVMQAGEDVLAQMHFTIEKADAEAGLVRTRPLAGAQFFELWRRDSVGRFNSAEANLHSLRRTVELNIRDADQGLCIDCAARTQRLSLPEQEVGTPGAGGAREMFSRSPGAPGSLRQMQANPESATADWIDLGSDSRLAAEILRRIEKRLEPAK